MSKKFKARALNIKTNRKRTVILNANTIEDIKIILLSQGFIEPFEIEELEPEPATERQLNYAKTLNIDIPFNVSKTDLSFLIDKKIENDGEPNPELLEYATDIGLSFSKYIGKKRLYNLIYENLTSTDKLAFFIFCVYRYLSDDRDGNLLKHKCKEQIYNYAEVIKSNPKIVKSIFNYRGEELRYFGVIRFSDGYESMGGSVNTIAYKEISAFVSEKFGTQKTKILKLKSKSGYSDSKHISKSKSGCVSLISIIIVTLILVIFTMMNF